jgi:hypothetical protein
VLAREERSGCEAKGGNPADSPQRADLQNETTHEARAPGAIGAFCNRDGKALAPDERAERARR